MKAEYINSFYKAIQDVFDLMLDLEVERGDLELVEVISGKDVNVILGVTGDLKGNISLGISKKMALDMVGIMSGMSMTEIDKFVSSAVGEVVNIVGGNALSDLSKLNKICDITPPQILIGSYETISITNDKSISIPIKTSIGEFNMNIAIEER